MYCVLCGVKLADGVKKCPLCGTIVSYPNEGKTFENKYSQLMPERKQNNNMPFVLAMTILSLIAIITLSIVCFGIYGELRWGGYPIFGILSFYLAFILPLWFRKPNPVIFIPIAHASILLYVLYICLKTGGKWFISFGMPVTFISCIIMTSISALARYVKGYKFFKIGSYLIAIGCSAMLIELFECISFNAKMWTWSLYVVGVFSFFGLIFILAGIIKPFQNYLKKNFFF